MSFVNIDDEKKFYIRNSERSSYRRCRFRWEQTYLARLQRKKKSTPLRFGSLVHDALEGWYPPGTERGIHPAETFQKLYAEEAERAGKMGMWTEDGDFEQAESLGVAMLNNYVEEYGHDEMIEIIMPEQEFQLDFNHPQTDKYLFTIVGTFDAICRDLRSGKIGLLEHKTAKAINTNHLQMDDQAGTYHAFGPIWLQQQGILEEGETLDFILYNFLRKAEKDKRETNELGQYLNKNGSVSKQQSSPLFVRKHVYRDEFDRHSLMDRVMKEAWEMRQVEKGKLPIYKNPTKDCSWDCDVYDICELHETGADWEELQGLTMEFWDPYSSHRERATLTWDDHGAEA